MKNPVPDHVGDPVSGPSSVNLPNVLTAFRLVLVPIFVYYLTIFSDSVFNQWVAALF